MNFNDFKLIAIDYVIPCVVVVGTGLISYILTGGEYEYPSIETTDQDLANINGLLNSEENELQQNCQSNMNIIDLMSQLDIKSDTQLIRISQVSEQLHTLSNTSLISSSSSTSNLAMKDILEQNNTVLKEIQKLLRNKKRLHNTEIYDHLCTSCKELLLKDGSNNLIHDDNDSDATSNATTKVVEIIRISSTIDWLINLRYSIFEFITSLTSLEIEASASSSKLFNVPSSCLSIEDKLISLNQLLKSYISTKEETISTICDQVLLTKGCEMLLMYISNIIKQPNVPRYRRISTNNQSYRINLLPLKGHHSILLAVGFVQNGSNYEWEWHTATTDNTLANTSSSSVIAIATTDGAIMTSNHTPNNIVAGRETLLHCNKENNTVLRNNHSSLETSNNCSISSGSSTEKQNTTTNTDTCVNNNKVPYNNTDTNYTAITNTVMPSTIVRCEDMLPRYFSAVDSVLKEAIELLTALKTSPNTCLELLNTKIEDNLNDAKNIVIITENDVASTQKDEKNAKLNYSEIFGQLTKETSSIIGKKQ